MVLRIQASQLWRWLQTPGFKSAFRAARRQVVEGAIGALQQAASDATKLVSRAKERVTPLSQKEIYRRLDAAIAYFGWTEEQLASGNRSLDPKLNDWSDAELLALIEAEIPAGKRRPAG